MLIQFSIKPCALPTFFNNVFYLPYRQGLLIYSSIFLRFLYVAEKKKNRKNERKNEREKTNENMVSFIFLRLFNFISFHFFFLSLGIILNNEKGKGIKRKCALGVFMQNIRTNH